MTANLESQKGETSSIVGQFVPNDDQHQKKGSENSSGTPSNDVGKEESDIGSPNESYLEPDKHLGWDSKEDPGNPQNWPLPKKIFHTAIPALYGFVM